MKVSELHAQKKKYEGLVKKHFILTLPFLFLSVSFIPWISGLLKENMSPDYKEICSLAPAFIILPSLGIFLLKLIRLSQKEAPRCPLCDNPIPFQMFHIVIATHNCTACGKEIIELEP